MNKKIACKHSYVLQSSKEERHIGRSPFSFNPEERYWQFIEWV